MAQANKEKSYRQMAEELSQLVDWFEGDSVNLDEAVGKYEQAMNLLNQMESYLKTAQNKVKKIAAKFESE